MTARRIYETIFIINASLEEQEIEEVITKVTSYIENNGGEITEINKWGRRRLAYPINKKYNGYYVHVIFNAKPSMVPLLERFLVLDDTILRHLTLLLPKKLRDYRKRFAEETGRTFDAAFREPEQKQTEEKTEETKDKGTAEVKEEVEAGATA